MPCSSLLCSLHLTAGPTIGDTTDHYGYDCSQIMCPFGDDPETENQVGHSCLTRRGAQLFFFHPLYFAFGARNSLLSVSLSNDESRTISLSPTLSHHPPSPTLPRFTRRRRSSAQQQQATFASRSTVIESRSTTTPLPPPPKSLGTLWEQASGTPLRPSSSGSCLSTQSSSTLTLAGSASRFKTEQPQPARPLGPTLTSRSSKIWGTSRR